MNERICTTCEGSGEVWEVTGRYRQRRRDCIDCDGKGRLPPLATGRAEVQRS